MDIQSTGSAASGKITPTVDAPLPQKPLGPAVETAAPLELPRAPTPVQLTEAVKTISKAVQEQSRDLEFSIDSDSNTVVVKVVDQGTKEVIRQIPSEEALELAKALEQGQGLLIRQKA